MSNLKGANGKGTLAEVLGERGRKAFEEHCRGKAPWRRKLDAKPEPAPAEPRRSSLLLADLQRVLERFEAAQKRRRLARLCEEDDAAYEAEMTEAAAEEREAALWLADLLLLLLRYARQHRAEALTAALAEALRPELQPLAAALARMEVRR